MFLSKEEREVKHIYKEIDKFWKESNDFLEGHIEYFKNINKNQDLNINIYLLFLIPEYILSDLLAEGFSQRQSMYIFSDFIRSFVLKEPDYKSTRFSDEDLIAIAKNVKSLLINREESFSTHNFSHRIYIGPKSLLLLQNEKKIVAQKRSKKSKILSYELLSKVLNCNVSEVKETIRRKFIQLFDDNNPITIDKEIEDFVDQSIDESYLLKIHRDDTPSAIIIEVMTDEFQKFRGPISDNEILEEMKKRHGEIFLKYLLALSTNDALEMDRVGKENPEILDSFIEMKAAQERIEELSSNAKYHNPAREKDNNGLEEEPDELPF